MTTYYQHQQSGDIATAAEWLDDFNCMDLESWFGKSIDDISEAEKATPLDIPHLVEVAQVDGEWAPA